MMSTFNLYVGSDNKTKKVDYKLLYMVLDHDFSGYTVNHAVDGVWNREHEQSCVVTIAEDKTKVLNVVKKLKQVLKQEAIGLQEVAELEFI